MTKATEATNAAIAVRREIFIIAARARQLQVNRTAILLYRVNSQCDWIKVHRIPYIPDSQLKVETGEQRVACAHGKILKENG